MPAHQPDFHRGSSFPRAPAHRRARVGDRHIVNPAREAKKIEHWFVREVVDGIAVLEGSSGLIEVSTGDVVPGVGRVEAISERDGRWVIATNKGAITAR